MGKQIVQAKDIYNEIRLVQQVYFQNTLDLRRDDSRKTWHNTNEFASQNYLNTHLWMSEQ